MGRRDTERLDAEVDCQIDERRSVEALGLPHSGKQFSREGRHGESPDLADNPEHDIATIFMILRFNGNDDVNGLMTRVELERNLQLRLRYLPRLRQPPFEA